MAVVNGQIFTTTYAMKSSAHPSEIVLMSDTVSVSSMHIFYSDSVSDTRAEAARLINLLYVHTDAQIAYTLEIDRFGT